MLTFGPSSGTVPAGGQLALAVTFAPTLATSTNFNVSCLVKKKPTKLTLNVKGEGYAVHDSLQIEGADGRLVELSSDAPNNLDFGQVMSTFTSCRPFLLAIKLTSTITTSSFPERNAPVQPRDYCTVECTANIMLCLWACFDTSRTILSSVS